MENELILGIWSSTGIVFLIISVVTNIIKTVILTRLHNSHLSDDTPIRGMGTLLFFTIIPLIGIFINDGIISGIVSIVVVWGSSFIIPFILKK